MNKRDKIISFILLTILLLSTLFTTASAVSSIATEPVLSIVNGELPVGKAGEKFELKITITNNSKYYAKDVRITPSIDSSLLERNDLLDYQEIDKVACLNDKEVTFTFRVKETAKPGVYPLSFNFSYKDAHNRSYSGSRVKNKTIYFKITKGDTPPNLVVKDVVANPEIPKAGKQVDLKLQILNIGEKSAKDIQFSLTNLSSSTYNLSSGKNEKQIDNISSSDSNYVSYTLDLYKELPTGVLAIGYKVMYKDEYGKKYEKESEIYISVLAKDDEGLDPNQTAPKIILSSYKTIPGIVMSGENFELDASFYNTNKEITVKNIKVSMSMKQDENNQIDSVFTPVNSTNVVYIDELKPHGTSDTKMLFNVVKSAEAKTYIMVLDMEYEDESGNQYKALEEIYIRVSQEPELGIENINYQRDIGLNEDSWFNTYVYNKSGVDIYNVLVRIEGDNLEAAKETHYLGSISKYNGKSIDTTIRALQEGKLSGYVTFSYEDATGKIYEQKKQFDMQCRNYYKDYNDKFDKEEEPEPEGTPIWKKTLRIIIAIIAGIIILVVFLKKRKKMKIKAIEKKLIAKIMNEK